MVFPQTMLETKPSPPQNGRHRRIRQGLSSLRICRCWAAVAWLIVTRTTTRQRVVPIVEAHTGGFGRRPPIAAAIFGLGNGKEDNNNRRLPPPPPQGGSSPPPPPRPLRATATSINNRPMMPPPPLEVPKAMQGTASNTTKKSETMPPPPPYESQKVQDPLTGQSPQTAWDQPMPNQPPQPMQQQPMGFWDQFPSPETLFYDLDQALQREVGLVQQVHNLSMTVDYFEQRDTLHLRQMDVLTERIMEIEAIKASKETRVAELQGNCTTLQKEMAALHGELKDYESRCSDFAQEKERLESELHDLRKQLKLTQRNAENLATLIETHRLEEEREKKKKGTKKKSRGFFAWFFGFGGREEEEDWDDLRETARSTLLQALQNERNNVEDLESAVMSLQSNNSAIADQVASRDAIIDELNGRIAVFEEDKVVLKAALKQLQKEMKEEAPKTARLKSDLKAKQGEINKLQNIIETLRIQQSNETAKLKQAIRARDRRLNESEANLTMIGTYVDKLEERLADFAVARRDINVRSKKMDELENDMEKLRREKEELSQKAATYEKQHAQMMKDTAIEKTALLNKTTQLEIDKNTTQAELAQLVASLQSTSHELARTQNVSTYWERVADDQCTLIAQLEKDQSELKTMRDDLVKKLREVVTIQVKAEEQAAMLQHNLTIAEERQKADSIALVEQMNLREKLEGLLKEAQEREKAMQVDMKQRVQAIEEKAGGREHTLLQEIAAQKQSILEMKAQKRTLIENDNESKTSGKPAKEVKDDPKKAIAQAPEERQKMVNTTKLQIANKTSARLEGGLVHNQTRQKSRPNSTDRVNLEVTVRIRPIRKFFAQTTGLHGFFSKKKVSSPGKQSQNATKAAQALPGELGARAQSQLPMKGSVSRQRPGPQSTGPPGQPQQLPQKYPPGQPRHQTTVIPGSPRQPPVSSQTDAGGNRLSQSGSNGPVGDRSSRGQVSPGAGPTYPNHQHDLLGHRQSPARAPSPTKRSFGGANAGK